MICGVGCGVCVVWGVVCEWCCGVLCGCVMVVCDGCLYQLCDFGYFSGTKG